MIMVGRYFSLGIGNRKHHHNQEQEIINTVAKDTINTITNHAFTEVQKYDQKCDIEDKHIEEQMLLIDRQHRDKDKLKILLEENTIPEEQLHFNTINNSNKKPAPDFGKKTTFADRIANARNASKPESLGADF